MSESKTEAVEEGNSCIAQARTSYFIPIWPSLLSEPNKET